MPRTFLTPAQAQIKAELAIPSLNKSYLRVHQQLRGPVLIPEYQFSKERKWRLDYYHVASGTGIELDEGVHRIADKFERDAEKLFAAACDGILVLRLTKAMFETDPLNYVSTIIQVMKARSKG